MKSKKRRNFLLIFLFIISGVCLSTLNFFLLSFSTNEITEIKIKGKKTFVRRFYEIEKLQKGDMMEENKLEEKKKGKIFPILIMPIDRKKAFFVGEDEKAYPILTIPDDEKDKHSEIVSISKNQKYILKKEYIEGKEKPYIFILLNFKGEELCRFTRKSFQAWTSLMPISSDGYFVMFDSTRSMESQNTFEMYDNKCNLIKYVDDIGIHDEYSNFLPNGKPFIAIIDKAGGEMWLEAYDLTGKIVWTNKLADIGAHIADIKFTKNGEKIYVIVNSHLRDESKLIKISGTGEILSTFQLEPYFVFDDGRKEKGHGSSLILSPEGNYGLVIFSWWSNLIDTNTGKILWKKNGGCTKTDPPQGGTQLTSGAENIVYLIKLGPQRTREEEAKSKIRVCVLDKEGNILFFDDIEPPPVEYFGGVIPVGPRVKYNFEDDGSEFYVIINDKKIYHYTLTKD